MTRPYDTYKDQPRWVSIHQDKSPAADVELVSEAHDYLGDPDAWLDLIDSNERAGHNAYHRQRWRTWVALAHAIIDKDLEWKLKGAGHG